MSTLFNPNPVGPIQCISFNNDASVLMISTHEKSAGYSISNRRIEKKWVGPFAKDTVRGLIPFYKTQMAIQIGKGNPNSNNSLNEDTGEDEQQTFTHSEYNYESTKSKTKGGKISISQQESTSNATTQWKNANNILRMISLESNETVMSLKTSEEIVNVIPRMDHTIVITYNKVHVVKTINFQPTLHYLSRAPYDLKKGWDALTKNPNAYDSYNTLNSGIFAISQNLSSSIEKYATSIAKGQKLDVKEKFTLAFQSSANGSVAGATLGIVRYAGGKDNVFIIKDAHAHAIQSVAVSYDGNLVASCSTNGTLVTIRHVSDPSKKAITFRRGSTPAIIHHLAFSPDSHFIAGASNSGTIHIWNIENPNKNSKGMSYYLFDHAKAFAWYKGEIESPCILGWNIENGKYYLRVAYLSGRVSTLTFDSEKGEDCMVLLERQIHPTAI